MNKYNESDIQVLTGLEPVRKRPGMYIGSIDNTGLHHLIWEIFDNAVDEIISGNATTIKLTINKDNSIEIEDNGRGIPTGINTSTKISTLDTVFTVLHAGGKFDNSAYKVSGGLHGVGASVVNALSTKMEVWVKKDKKVFYSRYINGGNIDQPCKQIDTTNRTGTIVKFYPDFSIFKNCEFKPQLIEDRIKETSFLYKNVKIIFVNNISGETKEFYSENGISEYIKFINANKQTYTSVAYFTGSYDSIEVEIAMQYANNSQELILSFANSIKTKAGGAYVISFKTILTEQINSIARKWGVLKDKDENLEGSDIREDLTAIIAVQVPEKYIQYKNQTKDELSSPEAADAVREVLKNKLGYWLEENRKDGEKIIEKALLARDARNAAKTARDEIKLLKDKNNKLGTIKSSKLTPAQSKDYSKNELFIVEGDSAGGTAKLARDKVHQAILPLRGKVINVEKAKLKDLLSNEEICTIIATIGTSIADNFNLENLRYNKIIIMTDADVDGSHIQTLLLTFFYRFMKKLIENENVYIACPPLYKFTINTTKKSMYVWTENELEELKSKYSNYTTQRYKGLGEMDAIQLKETTMSYETRKLIKVTIEDAANAERYVNILMGDDPNCRKEWIENNIDFKLESE